MIKYQHKQQFKKHNSSEINKMIELFLGYIFESVCIYHLKITLQKEHFLLMFSLYLHTSKESIPKANLNNNSSRNT